jgi:mono/diheme cytochrome c family protein
MRDSSGHETDCGGGEMRAPYYFYAGLCGLLMATALNAADPKRAAELSEVRGSIVFKTYCVLCHGPNADGKGRAAKNYNPPPANLTTSTRSDAYKAEIIRKGGAAMNRSSFMPPWRQELTKEQIDDLIIYLHAININNPSQTK